MLQKGEHEYMIELHLQDKNEEEIVTLKYKNAEK
jgi:hypothetical protein